MGGVVEVELMMEVEEKGMFSCAALEIVDDFLPS